MAERFMYAQLTTNIKGDVSTLDIKEKNLLESHQTKKGSPNRVTKDLPYQAEIAIGMRVMVKENVETDLDITNSTWGEIVGMVLHEDEPPIAQGAVVTC
jgi:hypothetical protein